jgi:serine/threonine-protein kinase
VDLAQGELLGGRYALGELLGRGGMGEVRAADDLRLGRQVAVKLLRPELADQATVRRRFEGEGRAAARLCHPNVAAVYDVGEHDGTPFLVMERVHGPGLDQELAAGPMSAARARRIFSEVLAALGAAHSAGLVHRDVKPANVLLAADDTVKVVDFGIAKALDAHEDGHGGIDATHTGQIVGTVAYMAPELVTGEPASVQSDLYSVGVMLYEALSGARPHLGDTPVRLARTIVHTQPNPLAAARPGVDPGLAAVVEGAMARRPEHRFSTAADMAAALAVATYAPADAVPTVLAQPPTELLTAEIAPTALPTLQPEKAETAARPGPATASGHADRAPAPSVRRRRRLIVVAVAGLAVAGLVWLLGASGGDNPSPPVGDQPAAVTPAPTSSGGIPSPLNDALERLAEVVR